MYLTAVLMNCLYMKNDKELLNSAGVKWIIILLENKHGDSFLKTVSRFAVISSQ